MRHICYLLTCLILSGCHLLSPQTEQMILEDAEKIENDLVDAQLECMKESTKPLETK